MSNRLPSKQELRSRYRYDDGQLYYRYRVSQRCKEGDIVGSVNRSRNNGYRQTIIKGVTCRVHRLIWKWHYGTEPATIDHINGDRSDNRIENLREVSVRENSWNRKKQRDLPPGIYHHHRGRYRVRMNLGRPNIHVGIFDSLDEALIARDKALANYGECSSD